MLKFKNTVDMSYQCIISLLYLQGDQKFNIIAILVYSVITFFGVINQN